MRLITMSAFRTAAVLALTGLLAACGAELSELDQWTAQQKKEVKPNVTPLSAPKKFTPQPYATAEAVDPFSNQKLAVALKRDERAPSSLLAG